MSYELVRKYFIARLAAFQFAESSDLFEFKTDNNIGKFILDQPEMANERPEINSGFFPERRVDIRICMKLGDNRNQVADYTNIQTRIDNLIASICNPTNFQASPFLIRNVQYQRHGLDSRNNDLAVFLITFRVEDSLTYA